MIKVKKMFLLLSFVMSFFLSLYISLYIFWTRTSDFSNTYNDKDSILSIGDYKLHSVILKGIPKDESMIDPTKSTVFDCSVLELPRIYNRAGNITPLENNRHIPFDIERVY